MTERTCSVPGCNSPHRARGWCKLHYYRMRVNGTPDLPTPTACKHCGGDMPPRGGQHGPRASYCSPACRSAAGHQRAKALGKTAYVPVPLQTKVCVRCGATFLGQGNRQYCSTQCARASQRERVTRLCEVEGCDKPYRAKGMCATHYNQACQPNRHRKHLIPCSVCGVMVEKTARSNRSPVCSEDCRYVISWGRTKEERDAEREAERRSHMQLVGPVRFTKTTTPKTTIIPTTFTCLVSTECRECGTWFIDFNESRGRRVSVTCSDLCHKRRNGSYRKFVTRLQRQSIYERDAWTCQLCQEPVDPTLPPTHTWAATLDHVIPRAHGGTHDPDNLRLAHRYCNSIRRDAKLPDAWFISPVA